MIKNYFKIAWRNLIKDRRFTILNLVGLACALLIRLWVSGELSMDKYNDNDAQLYQVMQNIKHDGIIETTPNTGGLLVNALVAEMPEIEHAATVVPALWFSSDAIISVGGTRLKAAGQFISKDYFSIFNFESLYETIKPCFFQMFPIGSSIVVRIKAGTEKQTIAQIQKTYISFNKNLAFDYKFLDEEYQALYTSEDRVAVLSKYFAGVAILISCLGLFGLAAFTAQMRQKEIGIRKVVGASVSSVVIMLSKDFLKPVTLAAVIAFPVVWWIMNNWPNNFAYHIPISADIFLIAGLSIIFITLLTISFQSIKAAITNPVKSLRAE